MRYDILKLLTLILLFCTKVFSQDYSFDAQRDEIIIFENWRIQKVEERNSLTELDSSDWTLYTKNQYYGIPEGMYWIETNINLQGSIRSNDLLILKIVGFAEYYEVYWDNSFIVKNGDFDSAKSGITHFPVYLNDNQLSEGYHNVKIFFSNSDKDNFSRLSDITFGYLSSMQFWRDEFFAFELLTAGIYLTTALLCLALFWGGNKHSGYLIFAVLCILNTFYYSKYPLVDYLDVSTSFYISLHFISGIYIVILYTLLVLFFSKIFNIRHKQFHTLITFMIGITPFFIIDHVNLFPYSFHILSVYLISLLIFSIIKGEKGSIAALLGSFIYLFPFDIFLSGIQLPQYIESSPNIFFVFFIILAMSQQIREDYRLHAEAERISRQLENELLRKNIQPHFLMNTLHSIKTYIREKPQDAVVFIQTLADEFRIVNEIAIKKLISVQQEIELCKTHLKLMSFRKEQNYVLETEVQFPEYEIPPIIFLTLLENGITHSFSNGESGCFILRQETEKNVTRYILSNSGSGNESYANKSESEIEEGLGSRYIKTRLEESYPGKWEFHYGYEKNEWINKIIICR